MISKDIRKLFLDFFKSKEHLIVPSAPMVVKNDPTLMFTNAGMNQFKDIFLGNKKPETPRVADTQKCLRVSGKHNDLEEVGHDTYHHTMFEMLGNWSFGDYFKKEAIDWAWEFLHEKCGISKDRIYATVFGGDKTENLERDEEAFEHWLRYLPSERILDGSKKDNFWEMGDQGPCGPCSEIHVDLRNDIERQKVSGETLVNRDHPLVIEIWNLVFMQYNRKADGSLEPLPENHVDTGMGFERLCMAMQGKKSNYDTDIFMPLINALSELCGKPYGKNEQVDIAMRVIADHIRAIVFAIADGQLPSNIKAGYVIRRILRRAVRYGYTFLDFREPFVNRLIPVLVEEMGNYFTELKKQESLIIRVVAEEEASFLRTLANGILKFENYIEERHNIVSIDGDFAFELFDTYGFPIDLTQLIAKERAISVDMKGFSKRLAEQKERSRQAAAVNTEDWVEVNKGEQTQFLGYDILSCEVEILRYRKLKTKDAEFYQLVFDQTPFYAESGGQVGDSGYIEANGVKTEIFNAKKENNLTVHLTYQLPEDFSGTFIAVVDGEKRLQTESNHTATHLLHKALRSVLGIHVEQKGSLVEPNRLRFDFSHFSKMTDEEIRAVERLVNQDIRDNILLEDFRSIPLEQANQMGAMALFGEKYGEIVRVVKFGDSIEFCGGTHAHSTGNIGMFKIVTESAIAAGVRRIEAITGKQVEERVYHLQDIMENISALLNNQKDFTGAIKKMLEENSGLKDQIGFFQKEQSKTLKTHYIESVELINGVNYIIEKNTFDPEISKAAISMLRNEIDHFVIVIATSFGDKPSLIVGMSDDMTTKEWNAATVVKELAKEIEGGGGGQPTLAVAGGKNISGLETVIVKARILLTK
ncbi:MAG: alanine--tRNA ligase [Bacteroidales bacterium]|jgi:alanyl-tRNA synthetase|nr:alanine--tRNA ligase [Bacteroidales bacterium]